MLYYEIRRNYKCIGYLRSRARFMGWNVIFPFNIGGKIQHIYLSLEDRQIKDDGVDRITRTYINADKLTKKELNAVFTIDCGGYYKFVKKKPLK